MTDEKINVTTRYAPVVAKRKTTFSLALFFLQFHSSFFRGILKDSLVQTKREVIKSHLHRREHERLSIVRLLSLLKSTGLILVRLEHVRAQKVIVLSKSTDKQHTPTH